MDIKVWFTITVILSMVSFITALKEGECEGNLFLYISLLFTNNTLSLVAYFVFLFFL